VCCFRWKFILYIHRMSNAVESLSNDVASRQIVLINTALRFTRFSKLHWTRHESMEHNLSLHRFASVLRWDFDWLCIEVALVAIQLCIVRHCSSSGVALVFIISVALPRVYTQAHGGCLRSVQLSSRWPTFGLLGGKFHDLRN
jgi:hypothetical protein